MARDQEKNQAFQMIAEECQSIYEMLTVVNGEKEEWVDSRLKDPRLLARAVLEYVADPVKNKALRVAYLAAKGLSPVKPVDMPVEVEDASESPINHGVDRGDMAKEKPFEITDMKPAADPRNLAAGADTRSADQSDDVVKGCVVRVVSGRKTPIGTEGKIFWIKQASYDGRDVLRVGFKDSAGSVHWNYGYNLEILRGPE